MFIGIKIAGLILMYGLWWALYLVGDEQVCRMKWDDISEYAVLAEVCKDRSTRASLLMAEIVNQLAVESEGEK